MFSLKFRSVEKGPFMADKAKKNKPKLHFPGGGEAGHGPPLLGNSGAKFSETSFPHFNAYSVFYINRQLLSLDNN